MKTVLKDIEFGNWKDAEDRFKSLKISEKQFRKSLNRLDIEELHNLAILGFYSREKTEAPEPEEEEDLYKDHGFDSREEYLEDLADQYDIPYYHVKNLADMLGESEDFDGLVLALQDGAY